MQVRSTSLKCIVVNKLPDGSRIIINSDKETMVALNSTAGAVWDACAAPTTLAKVTEDVRRSLDPEVTEELVALAIAQLESNQLVSTSQDGPRTTTRRQMFGTLGAAIALPVVATLTMSEQRAYATTARSFKLPILPTPILPPPPPLPPRPPLLPLDKSVQLAPTRKI